MFLTPLPLGCQASSQMEVLVSSWESVFGKCVQGEVVVGGPDGLPLLAGWLAPSRSPEAVPLGVFHPGLLLSCSHREESPPPPLTKPV